MSHDHPDHSPAQETSLDAWHEHPLDKGVPQKEHGAHANTHALLLVFAVVTVSTVAFSVVIGLFFINQVNRLKGERESSNFGAAVADSAAYKKDALAAQAGYGWTAEGNVRLPIDKAMEKVVAAYQSQPQEAQGQ
jgi:hypothetical protein